MNHDNIITAFNVLEEKGWTSLIDKRWEKDVINILKENVPNITQEEIKHVLDICLW
jgi:hypothetical protein